MVYIAVIVRVQYRDWAEHVYSLTELFCCKSHSGEEDQGEERREGEGRGEKGGLWTCVSSCTQIKTHSLARDVKTLQ